MESKNKLLKLIENENRTCPLTDEELGKELVLTRESITIMRRNLNIEDSRKRRNNYLYEEIKEMLTKDKEIRTSILTRKLLNKGFTVSRNMVSAIRRDVENYTEESTNKNIDNPFEEIVGFDKSLKTCIMQAKASIMYPPFGLPTLITGESGVGKTYFVEYMYEFAKKIGVLKEDSPLKVLNCADYSETPQLLLSILFGYKKGAFTGADKDTNGIVQEADNGILFLDEIHRLPAEGQEILFSILDKGKYRKLGESSNENKVNIMLIGATTENIESSLLLTFRRRIPMLIVIPSLQEREISEKMQFINYFFQKECNRINVKIFVEAQVIKMLVMKQYPGNIGQLTSDIQVICANAFARNMHNKNECINISLCNFLQYREFNEAINKYSEDAKELSRYIKDRIFLPFISTEFNISKNIAKEEYSLPQNIYFQIENKYKELEKDNMTDKQIQDVLSSFIISEGNKLGLLTKSDVNDNFLGNLLGILSREIIELIGELKKMLEEKYENKYFNNNVFSYLAIHLEETVRRINNNDIILNSHLSKICDELKEEFKIASEFCDYIEKRLNLNIPIDEVGFIAMYINSILKPQEVKKRVGIIIMSHGKIASEINNVVKTILNENFSVAIDMPLDENPMEVYRKVVDIAQNIDEGKGILFLVDMGSLINIGKMIEKELNIRTRTIDRVDLLSVLEAVRKSSMEKDSTLDDIYFSIIKSKFQYPSLINKSVTKPIALLAVCLSGKGFALKISEYLKERYSNAKIFTLGIMDLNFNEDIKIIRDKYSILAAIGTVDPEIEGINFIPFEVKALETYNNALDLMLNSKSSKNNNSLIRDDLILFHPKVKDKFELIEYICSILINQGYVKKEYLSSVLERENMDSTFFKWKFSLPHGDPNSVIKSAIVFVKLDKPMNWGLGNVDIVCLIAIKYSDKQIVSNILKMLSNKDNMQLLKNSNSYNQFKENLCNYLEKE